MNKNSIIMNESGAECDFKIRGDTESNAIYLHGDGTWFQMDPSMVPDIKDFSVKAQSILVEFKGWTEYSSRLNSSRLIRNLSGEIEKLMDTITSEKEDNFDGEQDFE